MDSRKLGYFVQAVEQGSLNKAAAALRVSQPALSKAIRLLEQELGVDLLERTSSGVRPSRYGLSLYSHAKAVVSELAQAREEIDSVRNNERRRIVVGALSTYSGALLVPAIGRLQAARQRVPPLRIIEKQELELVSDLRRGAFDFIIGLVRGGEYANGLTERVLFSDERRLVVRSSHPLARYRSVGPGDLRDFPWILPPVGTLHRGPIEQIFRAAGLEPPEAVIEGASMHFVRTLLLTSDFIVSLSAHAVVPELESGQLCILPIELPTLRRTIGVIHRQHHPIPPAARGLLRQLEIVCRQFATSPPARSGLRWREEAWPGAAAPAVSSAALP